MTRILIADDHAIVCKGLVEILADESDSMEVDAACSGKETLTKVLQNSYDLVLLDISMPDIGGLEVLKELKLYNSALPVLVLTMHPEEEYALQALRCGASGYLSKGSAAMELLAAIRKVLAGGTYVSSSLALQLASTVGVDAEKPVHEKLSRREFQVLQKIASGKKPRAIAEEMSLSMKTVSTHRERILRKMNMKHNAELTTYAIKHRLV